MLMAKCRRCGEPCCAWRTLCDYCDIILKPWKQAQQSTGGKERGC